MDLRWIILSVLYQYSASQNDPCATYQTINDTAFLTDSNAHVAQGSCGLFPPLDGYEWYRYTSTPAGEMATTCPKNSTCGAKFQIWIKDSLPSYNDGEKRVKVCISTDTSCCDLENHIGVKNCNGFFVYKLGIAPSCSRFCINATSKISTTVLTTEGTTAVETELPTTSTIATTIQSSTHSAPLTKTTTIKTTARRTEAPTTSTITTTIQTSTQSTASTKTTTIKKPSKSTEAPTTSTIATTIQTSTQSAPLTKTTTITTTSRRTEVPTRRKSTTTTTTTTATTTKHSTAQSSTRVIRSTKEIRSTTLDSVVTSPSTEKTSGKDTVWLSDHSTLIVVVSASVGSVALLALIFCIVHRLLRKAERPIQNYEMRHNTRASLQTPWQETFIQNTRFNVNSLRFDQ